MQQIFIFNSNMLVSKFRNIILFRICPAFGYICLVLGCALSCVGAILHRGCVLGT